jgi:acyl-ACP thioesterase
VLDTGIPVPELGRTHSARRRVRLSDVDAHGRLRLDAIARYLQDVAIDDVQETGWGMPEHLWFVRRVRIDVTRPFLEEDAVRLTTWCSGIGALAAGRRWSVAGEAGGRAEVDSVWIHLDAGGSPSRIDGFGVYADAAGERRVSTKLELPDPPSLEVRRRWPLRTADVDLHGHVNNAVYWQAVEDVVSLPSGAFRAELDYRAPLDADEELDLVVFGENVAFVSRGDVRAVARVTPFPQEPGRR